MNIKFPKANRLVDRREALVSLPARAILSLLLIPFYLGQTLQCHSTHSGIHSSSRQDKFTVAEVHLPNRQSLLYIKFQNETFRCRLVDNMLSQYN